MKKVLIILLLALAALSLSVSCASAPEPVPAAPPPPPPPSPPPPIEEELEELVPPQISVRISPQPFSPDGDGVDDLLTVAINIESDAPIHAWHIEIREPSPSYILFSDWEGLGAPPPVIVLDGYSAQGELVQSATDYHFAIRVTDIYNQSSVYQGTIWVDVLVHREGDILRVIVPSIVFAPNAGSFDGLGSDDLESNDRILRRISEILNSFDTYQIMVEGHANPTTAPGTNARANEEQGTRTVMGLLPLSQERARSVLEYLVDLGVDRSRLSYVGMGGTRTVVEYADRDNWWKNRRVEFILVR